MEEKTGGRYKAEDVAYVSVEELRGADYAGITEKLMGFTVLGSWWSMQWMHAT